MVGQILIGFYFMFFGLWNIYHWKPMINVMLANKLPSPILLLSIAIGWQIICGTMLVFNILPFIAAILLMPWTILIVFMLHPFWHFQGELKKQHMALFITNFTVNLGSLFLLAHMHSP